MPAFLKGSPDVSPGADTVPHPATSHQILRKVRQGEKPGKDIRLMSKTSLAILSNFSRRGSLAVRWPPDLSGGGVSSSAEADIRLGRFPQRSSPSTVGTGARGFGYSDGRRTAEVGLK